MPRGQLDVEQLIYLKAKAPGEEPILKGIDISIQPGEIIGVVDSSGSGKTTLARLLVCVLKPTRGTIRIDGIDLQQWDSERLGRHIGYVPQDIELFTGTVQQNIARMTPDATSEGILGAAYFCATHDFILKLPKGYDTDVGKNRANFSAGQRPSKGFLWNAQIGGTG